MKLAIRKIVLGAAVALTSAQGLAFEFNIPWWGLIGSGGLEGGFLGGGGSNTPSYRRCDYVPGATPEVTLDLHKKSFDLTINDEEITAYAPGWVNITSDDGGFGCSFRFVGYSDQLRDHGFRDGEHKIPMLLAIATSQADGVKGAELRYYKKVRVTGGYYGRQLDSVDLNENYVVLGTIEANADERNGEDWLLIPSSALEKIRFVRNKRTADGRVSYLQIEADGVNAKLMSTFRKF